MSNRKNVQVTILRKRILIRGGGGGGGGILQSNAAANLLRTNREFGHPTHCILHTQYISHTLVQTCVCALTADLRVLHMTFPDQDPVPAGTNQCLSQPTSSCYPIDFNYCLSKGMHMISRVSQTQFMGIAHRRRWCNFQIFSKYRYFICVFPGILPSIPCLSAHNKMK